MPRHFALRPAIGVGGTGWLIQGEVFPTSVGGTAASIGASVDWLANFVVIVAFSALAAAMGLPWVMVLLAGLAVLAVAFVARFLRWLAHVLTMGRHKSPQELSLGV